MNKMDVLRSVVEMFRIPADERRAVDLSRLMQPLPEEARMPPKIGVKGFSANLVGYKGIYVFRAANERLGVDGWVEVPIFGQPYDVLLPDQKTNGVGVDVEVVVYYPHLHRATFGHGSGVGLDLGDAQKAAITTARKRALMEIGIGWDGYTEHTGHVDPVDVEAQDEGPRVEQAPKQSSVPDEEPAPKQSSVPVASRYTSEAAPTKPQASPHRPITEAQNRMIRKLFHEKGVPPDAWAQWSGGRKLADLSAAEASSLIDGLLKGTHALLGAGAPSDDPYGGV